MTKAIILGNVGAGKSILLTVLTGLYRQRNGDSYFIQAMSRDALEFTERNLNSLQSQEWPPPTPPGTLKQFQWNIHFDEQLPPIELLCPDVAGETFIKRFAKGDCTTLETKELDDCINEANLVLLLVNLADFLNGTDVQELIDYQWAVQSCLNYAKTRKKSYCLVFTQIDRYRGSLEAPNVGGNYRKLFREILPQAEGVHSGIYLIPVSAVNETIMVPDAESGKLASKPSAGFKAENLDGILEWIVNGSRLVDQTNLARKKEMVRRAYKSSLIPFKGLIHGHCALKEARSWNDPISVFRIKLALGLGYTVTFIFLFISFFILGVIMDQFSSK